MFDASRSSNVEVFSVCESIASLNVTVTAVPRLTLVAPFKGVTEVTVGGVLSMGVSGAKSTSTQ